MTQNGSYLSKDDILRADDIRFKDVDVPEWGGKLRVRGLTSEEMLDFGLEIAEGTNPQQPGNVRMKREHFMRIVTMVVVDAEGANIFSTEDMDALGKKSLAPIQRIVETSMELSGFTEDAQSEMGKSSKEVPPVGSSTS